MSSLGPLGSGLGVFSDGLYTMNGNQAPPGYYEAIYQQYKHLLNSRFETPAEREARYDLRGFWAENLPASLHRTGVYPVSFGLPLTGGVRAYYYDNVNRKGTVEDCRHRLGCSRFVLLR